MKKTPLNAWIASLPVALLAPLVLWTCIWPFLKKRSLEFGDLPTLLGLFSIAAGYHFIAYAFTGLPIFLRWFKKPHLKIWTFPGALLTGTAAGALVFVILCAAEYSYLGAAYGFITAITAIAAYRQRPHQHENAHHLP